jgi:thiol-disulfide isomerase/thioredoxin
MHGPNAGDEGHQTPENRTPENRADEPQEGWFRFGDEPAPTPDPGERSAAAPKASSKDERPAAAAAEVQDGGEAERGAEAAPPARVVPAAMGDDEPEERIKPFVVSATPGGVDPDLTEAADAAVVTSVGGGRGFGLVGILTVLLACFGIGVVMLDGPRAADAESGGGSGGVWLTDIDEAMALSAAEGRPMLVQFTADWCPPCVAMREGVFASSAVQDRLATQFVTVRIDLTERGGPNDRVAQRFEVRSIPDIQIYHPDGWQMDRLGYVGSASEFLGKLGRLDRP